MVTVKILHLSDFHLFNSTNKFWYRTCNIGTGRVSTYKKNVLIALAAFVYERRKEIDAILISGDISVAGTEMDLVRSLDFLDSTARLSGDDPWLNSRRLPTIQTFAPKPIIVMPGNHDRFLSITRGRPGTLFYDFFSHYWNVGVGGVNSIYFPNKAKPVLAILCCDFTLNSPDDATCDFGRYGQGKV